MAGLQTRAPLTVVNDEMIKVAVAAQEGPRGSDRISWADLHVTGQQHASTPQAAAMRDACRLHASHCHGGQVWDDRRMASRESSGGAGGAGGVDHENRNLAWAASYAAADVPLPIDRTSDLRIEHVGAQTGMKVDDIGIITNRLGFVLLQAKKNLKLETTPDSPLAKALDQVVAQYLDGVPDGSGREGATRPIDPDRDRLIITTDLSAPATVRVELAALVNTLVTHPDRLALSAAAHTKKQEDALKVVRDHLSRSPHWMERRGAAPTEADLRALFRVLRLKVLGLEPGQSQRDASETRLTQVLISPGQQGKAFEALAQMAKSMGIGQWWMSRSDILAWLRDNGFALGGDPRADVDIVALRALITDIQELRSESPLTHLADLENGRLLIPPTHTLREFRDSNGELISTRADASILIYLIEEFVRLGAIDVAVDADSYVYALPRLPSAFKRRIIEVDHAVSVKITLQILRPVIEELGVEVMANSFGILGIRPKGRYLRDDGCRAVLPMAFYLDEFIRGMLYSVQVCMEVANVRQCIGALLQVCKSSEARANLVTIEQVFSTYRPHRVGAVVVATPMSSDRLVQLFQDLVGNPAYKDLSRAVQSMGRSRQGAVSASVVTRVAKQLAAEQSALHFGRRTTLISSGEACLSDSGASEHFEGDYFPPIVSVRATLDRVITKWKKEAPEFIAPY